MASDFYEQQQQNSASYMKANGEKQSYTSSDEIRVGSSEVMTHAQRQAFLKTSHLGKLFGVAHLLPEVTEAKEETVTQFPHLKRVRGMFKHGKPENDQYSSDVKAVKPEN